MGRYIIINEDTGEFIEEVPRKDINMNLAIITKEVDDVISEGRTLTENEFKRLLQVMYTTGEINNYNQLEMKGKFIDENRTFGLMEEAGVLAVAFAKLLYYTSWNNMIKKTSTSVCSDWAELCEVCGVVGRHKGASFKRFLTKNNIVKKTKCVGGFRMFVNPKVKRNGTHSSQKAILEFWEETNQDISIRAKTLFYSNGDINEEELKKGVKIIHKS
ncbi:MAG: hypothetical protein ACRC7R_01545 [Sarcina sp.]